MDNTKIDSYYVEKIIADLEFIIAHTKDYSKEQLENEEVLLDSVMFRLIQISENSGKLTNDFKQQHSSIPWRDIKGLRNRIVHQYGSVDTSIVYSTVKKDVPELLNILKDL